jgi:predicted ATP-grasp superfamily ATP-dependent carboligase
VLLTLGRLPKALELARAFHLYGCRVLIAEPFRWHVCRPSRAVDACYRVTAPNTDREAYLAEIAEIVRREQVRLVVPVSEEALHVADLGGRLGPEVTLLCDSAARIAALHDKQAFAGFASGLGLSVPETAPAHSDGARRIIAAGDYVAKPAHSCSGIGVEICRRGARHSDSDDLLVQRYVEGDHISSLSLVEDGREIVTVLYRGTVFAGTVAVCFERVDEAPAVREWISRFCRELPYSGFLAFDFIVDPDGCPWAIECNPRVTSGVHFLDPVSLGRALLNPATAQGVELKSCRRMQWAYSTLTEAYAALFRGEFGVFRRRLGALFAARDVVWSLRDPLPFLLMTPMSWEILWPAMTSGVSLGEATQRDIAWLSAPPAEAGPNINES